MIEQIFNQYYNNFRTAHQNRAMTVGLGQVDLNDQEHLNVRNHPFPGTEQLIGKLHVTNDEHYQY